jgi:hypothetical protein
MISQQMPQPYGGGLGAYGGGGGGGGYPQMPFSANQQRGFSHGMPYQMGYGMGNDIAARGMSALGAWGSAGIGVGTAALGMAFPPLAIPLQVVGAAGKHIMGSMVTGAQEQSNVNRVLGQMNFFNAGSRTGRGFSRQDAQMIGQSIREMQHLPEAMTSMGELTRIMDKVIQTGQMQGVRDPQEFQRKFKSTVKTLKDVAQVMGTTMEEAVPLLQEARSAGFYGQAGAKQYAFGRQMSSALTGMSQQQVGQTAQMGAQMGFQTGGSRRTGALHAIRSTNQIGMLNQMGVISNEDLVELTGKEGPEAIQEIGANMTQMAYRMRHNQIGTIMSVGLAEMKGGRFTGKMDESLVKRMRMGNIDRAELMRRTRQNVASRGGKISYVAKKGQLFSEMAGSVGVEGIAFMLHEILGERGYDDEDVKNIVTQRFGASERESELISKVMKDLPMAQMKQQGMEGQEQRRLAKQRLSAEHSPEAIKRRIGKKIENVTTEPFKKMGAEIHKGIADRVDKFIDELTGNYETEVSQLAIDLRRDIESGKYKGGVNLPQLKGLRNVQDIGRAAAIKNPADLARFLSPVPGTGNLSALGAVGGSGGISGVGNALSDIASVGMRGLAALTGEKTVGMHLAGDLEHLRPGALKTQGYHAMLQGKGGIGAGGTILDRGLLGGEIGLEKGDLRAAAESLTGLETGEHGKKLYATMKAGDSKALAAAEKAFERLTSGDAYKELTDPMKRRAYLEREMGGELGALGAFNRGGSALKAIANVKGYGEQIGSAGYAKALLGEGAVPPAVLATMREQAEKGIRGHEFFKGDVGRADELVREAKSGSRLSRALFLQEGRNEKGQLTLGWRDEGGMQAAAATLADAGRLATLAQGTGPEAKKAQAQLEAMFSDKDKSATLKMAGAVDAKSLVDNKDMADKFHRVGTAVKQDGVAAAAQLIASQSLAESDPKIQAALKARRTKMLTEMDTGRIGYLEKTGDEATKKAIRLTREAAGTTKEEDGKITEVGGGQKTGELLEHLHSMKKEKRAEVLTELPDSIKLAYRAFDSYAKYGKKLESKEGKEKGLTAEELTGGRMKDEIDERTGEAKRYKGKEGRKEFEAYAAKQVGLTSAQGGIQAGKERESTQVREEQIRKAMEDMLKSQQGVNEATKTAIEKATAKIK